VVSNPTATFDKVLDREITTFFGDSTSSGGYTGIDLGATRRRRSPRSASIRARTTTTA
jgi:hypothetical protein